MNPSKKQKVSTVSQIDQTADLIIESIQDIKGENILKLDLRKIDDSPASYFIICDGTSTTQVQAISNSIHRNLKEAFNEFPSSYEGRMDANWILMDYFHIVVHIFHKETREYYQLEDLWSDAKVTEYENL